MCGRKDSLCVCVCVFSMMTGVCVVLRGCSQGGAGGGKLKLPPETFGVSFCSDNTNRAAMTLADLMTSKQNNTGQQQISNAITMLHKQTPNSTDGGVTLGREWRKRKKNFPFHYRKKLGKIEFRLSLNQECQSCQLISKYSNSSVCLQHNCLMTIVKSTEAMLLGGQR